MDRNAPNRRSLLRPKGQLDIRNNRTDLYLFAESTLPIAGIAMTNTTYFFVED